MQTRRLSDHPDVCRRQPGRLRLVLPALLRASAANLVVNIVFFMTHPVFTPYYTAPITMLSLWTRLFASLVPRKPIADNPAVAQPASA
jgi:hypothetical protein